MNKHDPIYVAGHRGMVGSAICRELQLQGYCNVLTRSREELDLTIQSDVDEFFAAAQPMYVFLAAAKVGGIKANQDRPAEFIRDNIAIQSNVIHSAWLHGTKKLAFLGSSCIYPKHAPQPISEDHLLSGPLELTNEPYAIAKISGVKMCAAYRRQYGFDAISLMPTNLYGPGDNFDLETSHVLPALIRKTWEAKVSGAALEVWGTGKPRREFLHVDDLARAAVFLMETYSEEQHINVGAGVDVAIADLVELIAGTVGYEGPIRFNTELPDGTPRKLLDISRIKGLGWSPTISLKAGVRRTAEEYARRAGLRTSATDGRGDRGEIG